MNIDFPEIDIAINKSKLKKDLYQPTSFWENATQKIKNDIENYGIDNFRRLEAPLNFFVPTYGIPANSFSNNIAKKISEYLTAEGTKKQSLAMEQFLSGYMHALSDYRVFIASDIREMKPILTDFSESEFGNPVEQFEFDGKKFSRSALNYLLGICFLKKHINKDGEINSILEIGGGFGTLGEILKLSNIKYINLDIPPVSFISWNYLSKIYNENSLEPYLHEKKEILINELKPCSVFNSWDIELFEGSIDLFVNFISFQEMEPRIVENYLNHVIRLNPKWILLRNMREGKQIRKNDDDVGVLSPTTTEDYTKMLNENYSLIASNVFPFGYKTVDGFHSELLLYKRKNE
jgi:putative sugar O-methyltransferase